MSEYDQFGLLAITLLCTSPNTVEGERRFSSMNLTKDKFANRLTQKHLHAWLTVYLNNRTLYAFPWHSNKFCWYFLFIIKVHANTINIHTLIVMWPPAASHKRRVALGALPFGHPWRNRGVANKTRVGRARLCTSVYPEVSSQITSITEFLFTFVQVLSTLHSAGMQWNRIRVQEYPDLSINID